MIALALHLLVAPSQVLLPLLAAGPVGPAAALLFALYSSKTFEAEAQRICHAA
jgi:hypothetical protein